MQGLYAFPGQGLEDGQVALERGGLLGVQNEAAHPAVELAGQQAADDGRLDVFLLVLVNVEGVPQVGRDVIYAE